MHQHTLVTFPILEFHFLPSVLHDCLLRMVLVMTWTSLNSVGSFLKVCSYGVIVFRLYRSLIIAAATYNEQQRVEVPSAIQSESSNDPVDDLESQLNRVEHELREQRETFALQRQEELDTIDLERFRLQEMEDQERINALVEQVSEMFNSDFLQTSKFLEQEVKRRLFEERVEREKVHRMEREREKLLREREIWRIRRAHARDLETLKQKFDPG